MFPFYTVFLGVLIPALIEILEQCIRKFGDEKEVLRYVINRLNMGDNSLENLMLIISKNCSDETNEFFATAFRNLIKTLICKYLKYQLKIPPVENEFLITNAIVNGGMLAIEVGYSIKQYMDGEIDGPKLRREIVCSTTTAGGTFIGGVAGRIVGTSIGATIGSAVPVVGTAAGGYIGGLLGGVILGKAGLSAGKILGEYINGDLKL